MASESAELVKVQLSNDDGDIETLWAFPLGQDLYRLDNTPWYAYGVSWQDVIEARPAAPGELPAFVRVVRKSGYRAVRVILDPSSYGDDGRHPVLNRLQSLGCSYEGANRKYVAIDIPPGVDLQTVRDFLVEANVEWEHADPTYAELYPPGGAASPAG